MTCTVVSHGYRADERYLTHQGSCDCDRDHCESGEGGGEGAHPLLVGPLAEPAQQFLAGEDDVAPIDARVRVLEISVLTMNHY